MSKDNSKLVYKITIILLIIAIAWLFYDKMATGKRNALLEKQLEATLEHTRDSLNKELTTLYIDLNELETTNEAINDSLKVQQQKVKELITKLANTKTSDKAKINKLKAEIETLKKIMRSYFRQIDSLNQENASLKEENTRIKTNLQVVDKQNQDLTNQKDSLEQTVAVGKELSIYSENFTAMNKRDKKTDRHKKTSKFKVCFTLSENKIASVGRKNIYIRIAEPTTSRILTNRNSGEFMFQGNSIMYSAVREIEYLGKAERICVYYNVLDEELSKGEYTAFIFVGGQELGSVKLKLK